jgi:MFS family permease
VGLFVLAMAFSRQFWPFLLWNVACGLVIPFVDIPMMTWKMTAIPDEFRGRFNSLNSMLQMGIMPLGMCLGGIMVDKLGLVAMFILMGGAMFLAAISGLLDREFRNLSLPTQAQAPKLVLEVSEPERVLEHAI